MQVLYNKNTTLVIKCGIFVFRVAWIIDPITTLDPLSAHSQGQPRTSPSVLAGLAICGGSETRQNVLVWRDIPS